jgi:hypothetical protein
MKQRSIDMLKADMKHLIFYAQNAIKEDQRKNYNSSIKYIQSELKRIMENIK